MDAVTSAEMVAGRGLSARGVGWRRLRRGAGRRRAQHRRWCDLGL